MMDLQSPARNVPDGVMLHVSVLSIKRMPHLIGVVGFALQDLGSTKEKQLRYRELDRRNSESYNWAN